MASNIDPSQPVIGNPTTQSVRDNFAAAKTEIEALQTAVGDVGLTLIAGVPLIVSPLVASITSSEAHGLGVAPTLLSGWLVCLTEQGGYSAGDRVSVADAALDTGGMGGGDYGIILAASAVNVFSIVADDGVYLLNKSTQEAFLLTPARWSLIVDSFLVQ